MNVKNIITATFLIVLVVLGVIVSVSSGKKSSDQQKATSSMDKQNKGNEEAAAWTCPMHPSVREPEPGLFPI